MVGMSHHEVPLRVFGFVDKELDMLGVSCAQPGEFARGGRRSSSVTATASSA